MVKNDQIICVDIESTCWADHTDPPIGQVSDIIEIGYALLDVKSGAILNYGSHLVHPTRSLISEFCTQLTGITQADVDTGIRFDEACAMIRKDLGAKNKAWCSFGEYDRAMLMSQCKDLGINYPFSHCHLNIKAWYGLVHGSNKSKGLRKACELEGLGWQGRHHSGLWDTFNLARLVSHLTVKTREGLKGDKHV